MGIPDWGQSGNKLIWENQFQLIWENQFQCISDWGQSGNKLIWENQFWGIFDLGQSEDELVLGKINSGDRYLIWENQMWEGVCGDA